MDVRHVHGVRLFVDVRHVRGSELLLLLCSIVSSVLNILLANSTFLSRSFMSLLVLAIHRP